MIVGRGLPGSELLGRQIIIAYPWERFRKTFCRDFGDWEKEFVVKSLTFGPKILHVLRGDYVVVEDTAEDKWSLYEGIERTRHNNHIKAWSEFSRGYWTKKCPTKAGTYPTRDVVGYRSLDHVFVQIGEVVQDTATGHLARGKTTNWVGDFWSLPYPSLPGCK